MSRFGIAVCAAWIMCLAAGVARLDAQCKPQVPRQSPAKAFLDAGAGTIIAPGMHRQAFDQHLIDVTRWDRGILLIEIEVGTGESSASFDLFPSNVTIPTVGDPIGTLKGAYDIRPGASIVMRYPFDKPAVFILGGSGNWFSRAGASNTFRYSVSVENGLHRPVGDPGVRICCALGTTDNAMDPQVLRRHNYGAHSSAEPVGYIYTTHGGLVDFGHVRDNADLTRYAYETILYGYRGFDTPMGSVTLAPNISCDSASVLELAGAIAYVDGWAHELSTWTTQKFSTFSPEDLSSNVIGVELAMRALKRLGLPEQMQDEDFNKAVDEEAGQLIKELGGWPKADTASMLRAIQFKYGPLEFDKSADGKWWMYDLFNNPFSNGAIQLLRRNFSANPWHIRLPGITVPPPATPAWLNAERFERQSGKFYYMGREGFDATSVPSGLVSSSSPAPLSPYLGRQPIAAGAIPPVSVTSTTGQLIAVRANIAGGTEVYVTSLRAVTDAIAAAFAKANPGRDRP